VSRFRAGDRVGVPWLARTCGTCAFCRTGRENLCDHPLFTGCSRHGGYATHVVAYEPWCIPLPRGIAAEALAPLLCAGLIGWRALVAAGAALRLGIYGLGAAGSLVTQVALRQGREVCVFTRPGDRQRQTYARSLGVEDARDSTQAPERPLDAAIIFAPSGELVPLALAAVRKGGRVVCGGIHMTPLPPMAYSLLWGERHLTSVANLTRCDADEFLQVAARMGIRSTTTSYALQDANRALDDLRHGRFQGAAVLVP
jgi:propanol-preferring alcohol dehydrogenase